MLKEKERIDLINKLSKFSAGLAHIRDLKSLAHSVEEILEELMIVEYSGLYLFDPFEKKLKLIVAKGFSEEEKVEAERTAMDRHPGYVFKSKKVLYIPDTENDPENISVSSKRSFKVRSRLYIPVMNGNESIGAFGIVSSEKNKFKKDDIALLIFIGNIAGSIYSNINLLEKIKHANEKILDISNLAEENPNPIFRISHDRTIIYANHVSTDLLAHYNSAIHQPVRGRILEIVNEVLKDQTTLVKELEDGKGEVFQGVFHAVKNTNYINVYTSNITERKNIEKQLHKTSLIAEETDSAIIITNVTGEIEWINRGFTKLTGYTLNEVLGKIPGDILQGPDTDQKTVKEIAIHLDKRKNIECDILNYTKDGRPFWNHIQIQSVFNEEGTLVNFISIQRDITEKRELEEIIKASEEKTKMIIDSALDSVILINKEGNIINWNPQAERTFGWKMEEVLNKQLSDIIIPEEYREAHLAGIKKYIKTGVGPVLNQRIEITAIKKDGTIFPIELTVSPIKQKDEISFSGFIRDITELKKTQQELESISLRLSALIKELHSGILVEDENHNITLVNDKFCEMFNIGIPSSDLIGINYVQASKEVKDQFKFPEIFIQRIDVLQKNCRLLVGEELELNDGRFFERDYIPIFSNEKFMGNLWQYRDVTSRKHFEKDIKKAKLEAETANMAKSRFLANMSHEIRTPMNAIYGLIRLIEDTHLARDQKSMINKLRLSSDNLLKIINDILDFSKIESGQIKFEKTSFNLEELIKRIIESLEHYATDKNLTLEYYFDNKIDKVLFGDPIRIHQVLLNLVNNAIKFTEKGKVSVTCKLIKKSKKINKIYFEVEDTGIGIKKENEYKIFKLFEQEDESTTRRYGGTGLGLAISSELVGLMGGKINIKSKKGQGSIFYFTVNLEASDKEVVIRQIITPYINQFALKGKRILLVEDNKYNQYIAETILRKWSANVVSADNGEQALEILQQNNFDLILMDKQMPVLDGLETTQQIRNNLKLDIPIIALTANVVKGVIDDCLAAGMNDYLAKPFEPEDLYIKILNLLDIPVQYKKTSDKTDSSKKPKNETSELYDLSKLEKILGGNKEQLKKMILKFQEITPEYVKSLNDSLKDNDIKGIERTAHKIKASIDLIANNNLKSNIKLIHDYSKNSKSLEKLPQLIDHFTENYYKLVSQLTNNFLNT